MKALKKVDIVDKLKVKISEAKKNNDTLAIQLEKLLEAIMTNHKSHHSI